MMLDTTIAKGRARIAFAAGRSEKTISRWIRRGILPVFKLGPFGNSILCARLADLKKLRSAPEDRKEDR